MAGSDFMAKLWEGESKEQPLGTAKSHIFTLAGLPKNTRVTGFMFLADFDVTAAGAAGARPENIVSKLYDLIEHTSLFARVRATGCLLDRLYHAMHGRKLSNALFGNAIQKGRAVAWVPLSDPYAVSPLDWSIPTEYLEGKTIQVKTTGVTAVQLFGAGAVATCSLRLYLTLEAGAGAVDPAVTSIDFEDWGGQTIRPKMGQVFSHLFFYLEPVAFADPATITPDVQVTRANITYGGQQVIKNTLTIANVIEFNRRQVDGGFEDNNAEQINDLAVPFLPLYTPGRNYKLPAQPGGDGQLLIEVSGTLTALRLGYRGTALKDPEMLVNAADTLRKNEMPVPPNTERRIRTANKAGVSGTDVQRASRYARLLPGRFMDK